MFPRWYSARATLSQYCVPQVVHWYTPHKYNARDRWYTGTSHVQGYVLGQAAPEYFEFEAKMEAAVRRTLRPLVATVTALVSEKLNPWSRSFRPTVDTGYRRNLAPYYGLNTGALWPCMIVTPRINKWFPEKYVVGAHVWPKYTKGEGLALLGLQATDVTSARNGVIMLRSLELTFDALRWCFLYNKLDSTFLVKILDPSLKREVVSLLNIRSDPTNRYEGDCGITYADLDGTHLFQPSWDDGTKSMPFRRVVSCHTKDAFEHALKSGWIDQNTFDAFESFRTISDGVPESVADHLNEDDDGGAADDSKQGRTAEWVANQANEVGAFA